ncbi:MAG TPA: ABC transporter ATP-binding protein [Candidatus Pacebacteria bacterium]|nr:MAG: ABC transporter related protein [Microgenomates group bacterium GW2011_GWB1_45_17]KKU24810.1 MAG: ABC transporter related protein [Microgenomates group bacterium GW2011_GWC1_46_15]HAV15456.1 ABC transporter ATP-binding protein [Candidatus Paceibacterota bacterium]HCR11485.1 ABC transporter ATP-binding protein [Candidatus Paceibacterota bacterium]HCR92966.1 ABC transporter ATP-binding protein [Candidatus Paceibacterota bacterium]
MPNPAITFQHVHKDFYLQEDRTFKEVIPNLLRGKSLTKKYTVFHDLSFEIREGETVGIIGKNGAGKSTILKLIAGVTYPTKGTVAVRGRVAPLIELGAGFHPELSGYENIFLNAAILGMHKKEVEKELDQIIEFSELGEFIHVPVKKYSSGMYMRLGFSIAIHTNANILLIDEILAVGDFKFQKKCLDRLHAIKKDRKKTIIYVSHNEESVLDFCERALLLQNGKLIKDGDPRSVLSEYHTL